MHRQWLSIEVKCGFYLGRYFLWAQMFVLIAAAQRGGGLRAANGVAPNRTSFMREDDNILHVRLILPHMHTPHIVHTLKQRP